MCESRSLDAAGRLVGIDALRIDDRAFEQVGLHRHPLAGRGDALFDDAGLGLKLGKRADRLADQADHAIDQRLLAGNAEIAVEEVADRSGGHGELLHAVRCWR